MGWNDSRGVRPGGTTPGESFCPGIERPQGRHSVLVKRLQGSPSVPGQNASPGVGLS